MANLFQPFTYTLVDSGIAIDATYSITRISFVLIQGVGYYIGTGSKEALGPSARIDLVLNQPVTITSGNGVALVDGLIIDCGDGGQIQIISD